MPALECDVQILRDRVVVVGPAWPWIRSESGMLRRDIAKPIGFLVLVSLPAVAMTTRVLEFNRPLAVGVFASIALFWGTLFSLYFASVRVTFLDSGIRKQFAFGTWRTPEYTFLQWSKVNQLRLNDARRLEADIGAANRPLLVPHLPPCNEEHLMDTLQAMRSRSPAI